MDYRNLVGKSFEDLENELENEEEVMTENFRDLRIQKDLDRKKQFKQENKG